MRLERSLNTVILWGQRESEPLMFSGLYRQRRELLRGSQVSGVRKLDSGPDSIPKWL